MRMKKIITLPEFGVKLSDYFSGQLGWKKCVVSMVDVLFSSEDSVDDLHKIVIVTQVSDQEANFRFLIYYPLADEKICVEKLSLVNMIPWDCIDDFVPIMENAYLSIIPIIENEVPIELEFMEKDNTLVPQNAKEAVLKMVAFCLFNEDKNWENLIWEKPVELVPILFKGVPGFGRVIREADRKIDFLMISENCTYFEKIESFKIRNIRKPRRISYRYWDEAEKKHHCYFKDGKFFFREAEFLSEGEARKVIMAYLRKHDLREKTKVYREFWPLSWGNYFWLTGYGDGGDTCYLVDINSAEVRSALRNVLNEEAIFHKKHWKFIRKAEV